ncbi:DUF1996 domain-containing protein [Microbispora sp. H10830]|uniref:DUF1996 domain-containing protein n=1 Tax=Microbispora sp. H10830 TaxID=2729109 RepID=UPI0016026697|nr:DUF1996 domain-containing protein [Microbispora sp. H10830]
MRSVRRTLATTLACVGATGGLLVAGNGVANAAASGIWKIDCQYSHSLMDDPIVYPGQPGASHLHDFFGNIGTNANSTYASMDGVTSTCANKDRASYWAPALYRNGVKIKPAIARIYYTNAVSPGEEQTVAFPKGFRMIKGSAMNQASSGAPDHTDWGCTDDTQIASVKNPPPSRCASGGIQVRITFPSCWDGVMTGGNDISHVRYPSGGKCPAGFTKPFPTMRLNINYNTGVDVGTITLASGNTYSIHADFWNTWDQAQLEYLVDYCIRQKHDCGHFTGTSPGRNP